MKKEVTKRACLAQNVGIFKKGQTCEVSRLKTCDPWLACFDGGLSGFFEEHDLYFQDHIDGYNQKCFQ